MAVGSVKIPGKQSEEKGYQLGHIPTPYKYQNQQLSTSCRNCGATAATTTTATPIAEAKATAQIVYSCICFHSAYGSDISGIQVSPLSDQNFS
jgi:hypothetical protein